MINTSQKKTNPSARIFNPITIFMVGDVMTGRGIDQLLPHSGDPSIHESYMQSTEGYVRLAEQACGAIPKPVSAAYIWGESLQELDRSAPDLGLINLETGATTSEDYRKGKGINSKLTCS